MIFKVGDYIQLKPEHTIDLEDRFIKVYRLHSVDELTYSTSYYDEEEFNNMTILNNTIEDFDTYFEHVSELLNGV